MKKILTCGILLILFLFSYSNGKANIQYEGAGVGSQISFVVSGDHGGAFGFGLHGIVEFSLGAIGTVQYNPSLCFWFNTRIEKSLETVETETKSRQISINLFEIKYLIPVPESIFILPYAGGGFCIIIDRYEKAIKNTTTGQTSADPSRKDSGIGFNFYGGVDFPINEYLIPYFEIRFTATSNWAFRFTGGATFRF